MGKLTYRIGKTTEKEHFLIDIQDGLARSIDEKIEFGLIPLKLPVIDDANYRIFSTMEEYRKWSETTLPLYLGYNYKQ